MAAICKSIKSQIKDLAKNLECGKDVDNSLIALLKLNAPWEMYDKYNIKKLTYQYLGNEACRKNAKAMKRFLRHLKKEKKTAETKQSPSTSKAEEVKSVDYSYINLVEGYSLKSFVDMHMANNERDGLEATKEEVIRIFQNMMMVKYNDVRKENNGASTGLSLNNLARQLVNGKKNDKQVPSLFNASFKYLLENPRCIQRFCKCAPFELLEPVFHKCKPEEKVMFARSNEYAEKTEKLFEGLCSKQFNKKDLPKKYSFWWQYYESLAEKKATKDAQPTKPATQAPSRKRKAAPMMAHCLRLAKTMRGA